MRDKDEQADPFLHTLSQSVRTTLRGAAPNATTARAQILPPAPQTEVEPLPEQTPASTSTDGGGG